MGEGDQILNCWDDKIAIRRVNGEVDIVQLKIEDNLPSLSNDIWRVTYGNNTIEIIDKDSKAQNPSNIKKIAESNETSSLLDSEDDADFVMSIRPKKK
jgi:hypothetical protein